MGESLLGVTAQASKRKVMAKQTEDLDVLAPDRKPLTGSQASRLASLTGLNPKELSGLSVAQISESSAGKLTRNFCFSGVFAAGS